MGQHNAKPNPSLDSRRLREVLNTVTAELELPTFRELALYRELILPSALLDFIRNDAALIGTWIVYVNRSLGNGNSRKSGSIQIMKRGAFILLEGIDHSGKTTQCQRLVNALNSEGKRAKLYTFPSLHCSSLVTIRPFNDYWTANKQLPPKQVRTGWSLYSSAVYCKSLGIKVGWLVIWVTCKR